MVCVQTTDNMFFTGITLVNAAPAIALFDSKLHKYTDILCVNETEVYWDDLFIIS